MSFPQKASLLPTSVGLSPYPLTTYHLLGAALYLSFFIKEAVGGISSPSRSFIPENSSTSWGRVEGERSVLDNIP